MERAGNVKKAALVMGFGLGRANEDVARFAEQRSALGRVDLILAQDAVVAPLANHGLSSHPMHGHHDAVYVDTLHAAAFGLLKLKDIFAGEPVEIEIIAHSSQLIRARNEALLALTSLSRRPMTAKFFQRVTIAELKLPADMRLNEWSRRNSRHFWTCSSLIYWLFDSIFPIPLKFHCHKKRYEQNPERLYARLAEINRLLQENGVHWHCEELP
jgi:hypothetical protein